jgi:endonuclease YncB( thermonuclease family)
VLEIDGFWVEDGQLRFRRLGGVVGFALSEVARLVPRDPAPVDGRMPAQFLRRLGPERLEARVGRAVQPVRLIGVEPVPGATSPEDPWAALTRGLVVQLEFDRQRDDPGGDWLAYVHLPNGRMLNAELIRVGLARPRPDPRNLRYVDLFEELWRTASVGARP